MKIAQFLQAGCHVKILLADIHGFLDNLKAPIELVEYRAKYYRYCITALLKAVNVPIDKLEFILGSSYQLSSVCMRLRIFSLFIYISWILSGCVGSDLRVEICHGCLSTCLAGFDTWYVCICPFGKGRGAGMGGVTCSLN